MSTNHIRSSQRGTVKPFIVALLLTLLAPLSAFAQGTLAPVAQQVFLDASGNVLNNAKLCWYAAGTLTPQATYSDPTLMTANANPVRTNSAGRPTTGGIYLSATSYKLIVLTAGADNTCATGTTIYSQDNISAIPATAVGLDITGTAGENLAAGDVVYLSDGTGSLTAGRWYKADADATYASTTAGEVGIVPSAIASGSAGSMRVGGRITGLSGLTAGTKYFASATAGALAATSPTNSRFIGTADTTTSLLIASNPTASGGPRAPPCGRLTLTTGVPVTTADVTAATTLFYAPYGGCNTLSLFNGNAWADVPFTQVSIAVPATTSQMYDVWLYNNAGVVTMELLAWTNDTTRATALTTAQDGVLAKTGVTTRLYVGSFRTTAVSGQTEDSFAKRYVWNYYNRVSRPMRVLEATASWGYSTATLRQANGAPGNQLDFVIGVAEVELQAQVVASARNSGANVGFLVAIGLNSTSAIATGCLVAAGKSAVAGIDETIIATLRTYPPVGKNTAVWLEYSEASPTTTWEGAAAVGASQSGITGAIDG